VGRGGGEESDGLKWTGSEVEAFGRTKRVSGLVEGLWLAPHAINGVLGYCTVYLELRDIFVFILVSN
jgi:hypothetical protein